MLSPSRMMSLAAPLLLAYLTYTTVGSGTSLIAQMSQATPNPVHKKHEADSVQGGSKRNPFDQAATAEVTELLATRLPGLSVAGDEKKPEPEETLRLNGTVIMGKWRMAIINGKRLNEGDEYDGLRLAAISRDKVIFIDRAGRNVSVRLDVALSDEIEAAGHGHATERTGLEEQAPLQRGVSALTARSQGDILQMLGIPEN